MVSGCCSNYQIKANSRPCVAGREQDSASSVEPGSESNGASGTPVELSIAAIQEFILSCT